jgi:hypothetical protein
MFMALASLVRPRLQYFCILFGAFLLLHLGWQKEGKLAGMVIVGFVVCFSPWVIRNIHALGVISNKTLMINFLHHGMYPNFTYDGLRESRGFPYRYDPRASEISRDLPSVLKEISIFPVSFFSDGAITSYIGCTGPWLFQPFSAA